ncbi:MAG: hypothetical protein ACSHX8_11095 [Opitutaceae bacterium]
MARPPQDAEPAPPPVIEKVQMAPNDVSILYPLPKNQADVDQLISISELSTGAGKSVFPINDFKRLVEISESDASKVGNRKIKFSGAIKDFGVWKIAGIRVDPIAVGGSAEIEDTFGQSAQIRLILQPVTASGNRATAHDVTFHLIYSFSSPLRTDSNPPCKLGKATSDLDAFKVVIDDLRNIKEHCENDNVQTGNSFGVHPGLARSPAVPGLNQKIHNFLSTHLRPERLNAAAVMGLNNGGPEPWIFLSMLRMPQDGKFSPFPAPGLGTLQDAKFAQMISFIDGPNRIQPAPASMNRQPATDNLCVPIQNRRGVSTAILFNPAFQTEAPAIIGSNPDGTPIEDSELKNRDIADWIANPEKSHFFNTDCASCHTETTRREILDLPTSAFAYKTPEGIPPLDPSVTPSNNWNVRNFGWFRNRATITQRTANETAEVVEFINENFID